MRAPFPILVFDGDCGFCRRWVTRWRRLTGARVLYIPLQWPFVLPLLGISRKEVRKSVHWVEPGRPRPSRGASAVFRLLLRVPRWRGLARVGLMPPFRWAAEGVYRMVASHRAWASALEARLSRVGRPEPTSRDVRITRALFLLGLGAVYAVAFTSLRSQVRGLYGRRGILPVAEWLPRAREVGGRHPAWRFPTVLWWAHTDRALVAVCTAGQLASALLMAGIAPRMAAFVLWALYLSLVTVGRDFLSFQWDVLLLEAGLLAVLAAPRGLLPSRHAAPPPRAIVWLFRWLVFRLYFESGVAKLQSGDETWRKLEACRVYYETEPLPNRLGWLAHHLPRGLQAISTATVLAVECGAPFLVLGPRRARFVAFGLFSMLQATFALTGNYGFFNGLSALLGLWLLDDGVLARVTPRALRATVPAPARRFQPVPTLLALPLFSLSLTMHLRRFHFGRALMRRLGPFTSQVRRLEHATQPFHPVSAYGLFAMMTLERPEISVEGSEDGHVWREYGFRYKAGEPSHPPRQVAPHQPRLDWQMWFAALGGPPRWFVAFLTRLLEGSEDVLALLQSNPFPDTPPRYVRATLHDYRMTTFAERRRTGTWWRRERRGTYVPQLTLDGWAYRLG